MIKINDQSIGLTSVEAKKRQERYGPNAVTQMAPRGIQLLLPKFWGIIPWMLEIAIILDLFLARWIEAAVIALLLVSNALIAFFQESRAKEAVALLRKRLSVNARVKRDGQWQVVPAAALVPGDLVHLRVGDIVPADIGLAEGQILVDQSQLTGESLPMEQSVGKTAYSGSTVSRGETTGIVEAIGSRTYFGKTAELVRTAEAPRRLELLVIKVSGYLGAAVLLLAVVALITMISRGTPLTQMLPFSLMLLVTSVPVALPMMFTMSAAIGARGLANKGILATRLSAMQDAAAMDILCLDKTGTLTENRLAVANLVTFSETTKDELLRFAALASEEATQDPIDLAIIQSARERKLLGNLPARLSFIPFDPATKRSEAIIPSGSRTLRIVKGEPSIIAKISDKQWSDITNEVGQLSADGSRILAVATGEASKLHLVGLIALSDPPRKDSAELITQLAKRGVRVLLITGDGEATARAIAAKVGISGEIAPIGTIHKDLDPKTASRFTIFPGVFPEDKFLLVQALQKTGHTVGMTGDGVNDAPALRQADVGIAVASATDVAKASASLVLTNPGIGEIVMAISGSRMIFQRMKNFVLTMIGMKLSTPMFFSLGVIVFGTFVLTPLQIVLLVFLGNIVTMSVSMDQVTPSSKPDSWSVRSLIATGVVFSLLLLFFDSSIFWTAGNILHLIPSQTQTLMFFWLVIGAGQALLYVTRGQGFFWERPYPGKAHLLATSLDLVLAVLFTALGIFMASVPFFLIGGLLVLAGIFLVIADILKIIMARFAAQLAVT